MLDAKIIGTANVDALATSLPRARGRIKSMLSEAMNEFANRATANIKRDYLSGSGDSLKVRTGRLRSSIRFLVVESDNEIRATFGSDVPYAAIHEMGGQTRPHEIAPRRKSILRFFKGGQAVFARRVNHPGSTIRARPFLQPGVEDEVPWMRQRIDNLLMQAATEGLGG